MSSRVRKAVIRAIYVVGIVLLLLGIASDTLPFMSNSSMGVTRRSIAQRGLSERIAKNAVILVHGDKSLRAQAVSELQVTLPTWERVQQGLLKGDSELDLPEHIPDDINLLLLQVRGNFNAIDAAAKAIIAHPDDPENETQLSIILEHEAPYYLTMASVADLWQGHIQDVARVYFGLKLGGGLTLISFWTLLITFHRKEKSRLDEIIAGMEAAQRKRKEQAS